MVASLVTPSFTLTHIMQGSVSDDQEELQVSWSTAQEQVVRQLPRVSEVCSPEGTKKETHSTRTTQGEWH